MLFHGVGASLPWSKRGFYIEMVFFLRVLFIAIMEPVSYDTNSPIISIVPYPGIVVPLGCRLLINMREAGDKGLHTGMTCASSADISGIKFAEHSGVPCTDDNVYEVA